MSILKHLLEIDEFQNEPFNNSDERMLHLFKVQSAKCSQLFRFMRRLADKYQGVYAKSSDGFIARFANPDTFSAHLRSEDDLIRWAQDYQFLQEDKIKLKTLYFKMYMAKKIFEDNNGIQNYVKIYYILKKLKKENVKENLDDFENVPFDSLEQEQLHLYRVQLARCYELRKFLNDLRVKYKNFPISPSSIIFLTGFVTVSLRFKDYELKDYEEKLKNFVTENELKTFKIKYNKMFHAKLVFEASMPTGRSFESYTTMRKKIKMNIKEASETPHKHIIWVDDIRSPPASIEANCDIARTYDEAVDMLSHHMYTDIYLDHDIASYDDTGRERTGYDVVLFLVDRKMNNEYVPKNFHMLTTNPVGRKNMEAVISRYLRD